jgi:hypothetical protein
MVVVVVGGTVLVVVVTTCELAARGAGFVDELDKDQTIAPKPASKASKSTAATRRRRR